VLFDPHDDRLPRGPAALLEGGRMPAHTVRDLVEVPVLLGHGSNSNPRPGAADANH
jgi:hypothetical protein